VSKIASCASFARASVAAACGASTLLLWSSISLSAEEQPAQAAAEDQAATEDEELSAVQVTGTRIQSPNATASNPVTSVSGEEMRRLGMVNVSDALTQLIPQNLSSYMPTMVGDNQAGTGGGGMDTMDRGSYFIGSTIPNLRGLDPTFGSRTLTLVDGRRVASTSNQADVVDLNTIPSNLLERMDVVTGGASATYGSGAVAGVVNLVLNSRLTGINLDMDYGVNAAGDGNSPHVAISGGMPLFGGRAHMLLSGEYQKTAAIRDCADARSWCRESRSLFTNSTSSQEDLTAANAPLQNYTNMPAHFEVENLRFEQRWSEGAIYHNDERATSGFHFDASGVGGTEYAYGYRGGASPVGGGFPSVVNGSGQLATSTSTLLPSNERKVFFSNFEYNLTDSTTGYFQARYANTQAENRNLQTTGNYCARFDSPGQPSTFAAPGAVLYYTQNAANVVLLNGQPYPAGNIPLRDQRLGNPTATAALAAQLGFPHAATTGFTSGNQVGPRGLPFTAADATWLPVTFANVQIPLTRGISWPWWVPVDMSPNPPTPDFDGWARDPDTGRVRATGTWRRVSFTATGYAPGGSFYNPYHSNDYWLLESITMNETFDGSPLVLPQVGRNSYAFLNNLSQEALLQVQSAFNRAPTSGAGNAGVQALYGTTPCSGFTAIRKLWNPQIWRETRSTTDTYSGLAGVKGRFGSDWRWDGYYQYGGTDSKSVQKNNATNLRLAFALDAVIDDRPDSATYGQPICRINRDGAPALDTQGRPITGPDALAALAADCKPLNLFGDTYSNRETFGDTIAAYDGIYYDAAALQNQALDYAFVDSRSAGTVSQQIAAFNTSGTLWQGWAGPLTAAFGVELRENKTDNAGTQGDFYKRADLANVWADAFGGRTRVAEGYTEMDLPLVAGQDGANLFAVNAAVRYGIYNNKGGAGTTGESATQRTPNWKFSTTFEPFDWLRFRLTRSRDLRAADYRELFVYQPGIPDEFAIRNPWREGTSTSIENQNERYAQVRVGNSSLKPEKSNTLTLGFVLSPGGWAQGARLSVDYFDIRVKDGINTPFNNSNPVSACFEGSNAGMTADDFLDGGTPSAPNMDLAACKELTFNTLLDANGNAIPGSQDLQDLLSFNRDRPTNSLPYQRRGLDFSASYNFPLNRAFESLPGSLALNLRASKALESSGVQQSSGLFRGANPSGACGAALDRADPMNYDPATGEFWEDTTGTYVVNRYQCVDLAGQIRSSVFIPGVAATPTWTGNLTASYLLGDFTGAVLMRYIGSAKLDRRWVDDPEAPGYYTETGAISNASVDNNDVKPYARLDLNLSYDLRVANLKQFRVFGSVVNVMDKSPPFTGGGISGATAGFHDTLGRAFRFGLQAKF
jgi:outer membrane receptor protein involved in Fe transport